MQRVTCRRAARVASAAIGLIAAPHPLFSEYYPISHEPASRSRYFSEIRGVHTSDSRFGAVIPGSDWPKDARSDGGRAQSGGDTGSTARSGGENGSRVNGTAE